MVYSRGILGSEETQTLKVNTPFQQNFSLLRYLTRLFFSPPGAEDHPTWSQETHHCFLSGEALWGTSHQATSSLSDQGEESEGSLFDPRLPRSVEGCWIVSSSVCECIAALHSTFCQQCVNVTEWGNIVKHSDQRERSYIKHPRIRQKVCVELCESLMCFLPFRFDTVSFHQWLLPNF